MAGVFIPNMEIPKSCWECPLVKEDETMMDDFRHWCALNNDLCVDSYLHVRHIDCPMKDVATGIVMGIDLAHGKDM